MRFVVILFVPLPGIEEESDAREVAQEIVDWAAREAEVKEVSLPVQAVVFDVDT